VRERERGTDGMVNSSMGGGCGDVDLVLADRCNRNPSSPSIWPPISGQFPRSMPALGIRLTILALPTFPRSPPWLSVLRYFWAKFTFSGLGDRVRNGKAAFVCLVC